MPGHRPTLSDVAAMAGVSRQVVSAVLAQGAHAGTRFSEETRERVMTAVAATSYRRNRSAEQMRTGRQGCIALLSDNLNKLPPNTLEWLLQAAADRGLLLVLERLCPDQSEWAPRLLREHYADGVIACDVLARAQRATLHDLRLPLVEVNTPQSGPGCIHFELEAAMQAVCADFRACGCLQIALVAYADREHFSQHERLRLLRSGLPDVPEPLLWLLPTDPPGQRRQLRELLTAHPEVDGILLNNDSLAPPVAQAAAACGRPWPERLQLRGFDASPVATSMDPPPPSWRIVAKTLADAIFTSMDQELQRLGSSTPVCLPYFCENRP